MRTMTLPPVRVTPELRDQIDGVLASGETISSLVERAVRQEVERRVLHTEFHRRGFEAIERVEMGGPFFTAEQVLGKLEQKLVRARETLASK